MQIEILRHLLFVREYGDDGLNDAVHAEGLIHHLKNLGFSALTKQSFSSRVIGPLRDAGLILAGSNDGLRIAMTWQDVRLFLEHDDGIIGPMILHPGDRYLSDVPR